MALCQSCGASYSDSLVQCPFCHRPKAKDPTIRVEVLHAEPKEENACPICKRSDHSHRVSAIAGRHGHRWNDQVHAKGAVHGSRQARRAHSQGSRVAESSHRSFVDSDDAAGAEDDPASLARLLRRPDFAPPSAFGQFGKFFFGEAEWRKMRVEVRRWLAHLQPFLGGVVGALAGVLLTVGLILLLRLDYRSDPLLNGTALGYVIALALWGAAFLYGFAGYSLVRFLAPRWQRAFEKRVDEEALAKPAHELWEELYYCERDDVVYLPGHKQFARPSGVKEFCLMIADRQRNLVIDGQVIGYEVRSK